jgi:hypothetical protein
LIISFSPLLEASRMPTIRRSRFAIARATLLFATTAVRVSGIGIASLASVVSLAPGVARAQELPAKLSDSEFWKLVTDFSEPGGSFRSDNFVSNETMFQWVIPELQRTTKPGGVYLGVGPDQNFTYIVALKPKISFIFDIRRQNMLTHLMYKAVFEQATDRADFLSRLFSRARPPKVDTSMTANALFAAFSASAPDSTAFRKNIASITDRLTKHHGFKLSDDDLRTISYVYEAFVSAGPDLTYNFGPRSFGGGFGRGRMPTYADLQMESDSSRVQRSYLATEANFRAIKEAETNNLVVPVVGNFAARPDTIVGPGAIRRVGAYLKEHKAIVTAFYLSNVEQYLFNQGDDWSNFYTNASTLPIDSTSTFIRSVFNGMGTYGGGFMRGQQMLASILAQVSDFKEKRLMSYADVINTSR